MKKKKYYGQINVYLKHLLTQDIRKTKYIEMQTDLCTQRQFVNFCTTKSFVEQNQQIISEEKAQTKNLCWSEARNRESS